MKKLALITGGQTGIGFGIAKELVNKGWDVALASSGEPSQSKVLSALKSLGDSARYYQHDVRDIDAIESLLDKIESNQGAITSLVSNAGVSAKLRGDMLDMTPENFDFNLDINLKGAFFLAQSVARRLVKRKSDQYYSMIFVTSVSASMVSIERAEYCISKAGAGMAVQLFASRLADEGIGVYEIRPGIIETSMTSGVKDSYTSRIENGLVPSKRWGQPEDIGRVVLPLISGQMSYANGAVIPVDGGLSIHRL